MLWIPITMAAAGFQVARNALQRGLLGDAGPWGATLVRFLFGLPFSLAMLAVVSALTPAAKPAFGSAFWLPLSTGAFSQLVASAALLVAMRRAGFAIGTALQQSSLPLSAVIGLVIFRDNLHPLAWVGVAMTTFALAVLTWPKGATGPQPLTGALFGLASGVFFGFSLNAIRHAELALEPTAHVFSAVASVVAAQALQSAALTLALAFWRPEALAAVIASWRQSLAAGLCGATASLGWFTALALAAAGPVRAVGMVEMPMATLAGRSMFAERLTAWQWAAVILTSVGVALAALG